MECDNCKVNQYEVRYCKSEDKWLCNECFVDPIVLSDVYVRDTVTVGNKKNVSRARIDELNRRVILNYNPIDGSYKVGRRGENGKIQDRQPDYRP